MDRSVQLKIGNSMSARDLRRQLKSVKPGDKVVYASVVPALSRQLKQAGQSMKFGVREVKLSDIPLKTPYRKTLGVDRALNVFSASKLTDQSFVVLDFGTATTIEFYDRRKGYLGGWIAPGLGLLSEALHLKTAKLPMIHFKSLPSSRRAGRNTKDSIVQAFGVIVSGLMSETKAHANVSLTSPYKIFLTGGGAASVRSLAQRHFRKIQIVPDLILKGLREL